MEQSPEDQDDEASSPSSSQLGFTLTSFQYSHVLRTNPIFAQAIIAKSVAATRKPRTCLLRWKICRQKLCKSLMRWCREVPRCASRRDQVSQEGERGRNSPFCKLEGSMILVILIALMFLSLCLFLFLFFFLCYFLQTDWKWRKNNASLDISVAPKYTNTKIWSP